MEETQLLTSPTVDTKIDKEINPYFAIEEDVYGDERKKNIKSKKIFWTKFSILSSLLIAVLTLVIYDISIFFINESKLDSGTLVNGLTYKELKETINKSNNGDEKIWIDFDNPLKVGDLSNMNISLTNKTLTMSNYDDSYSYLLVNPNSKAIYQSDLIFNTNQFDFNNRTLIAGDYLLCAYTNPDTIPYRPVVDNYFYSKLGSSSYRRVSQKDNSIQIDDNISLIQDPTLLSLVIIRIQ